MNMSKLPKSLQYCLIAYVMAFTSSCSALLPVPSPPPSYYSLDGIPTKAPVPTSASTSTTVMPSIIIATPRASAGYDTRHMIYTRQAHKLEYFAHSEWVDVPAQMLVPLMVTAIERSNAFKAVVVSPVNVSGEYRLDSEIVRLQQEFDSQPGFDSQPSKVRFTLRVYMVNNATRKVIAMREFDEIAIARSNDPYGGVIAANQAVQLALEKLSVFCKEVFIQNN